MAHKVINIDGKEVPFTCTAGTLRRYRMKFRRDLLKDAQRITKAVQTAGDLDDEEYGIFEDVAYIMAKQADDTITEDVTAWLDNFGMLSVQNVMPEIIMLWLGTVEGIEEAKKNNQ